MSPFTARLDGIAHHPEAMLPLRRTRSSPKGAQGRQWPFEEARWSLPHPLAIMNAGGSQDRQTLLGYAENISRHGMMIGTVWPKEPDSRLQVEFALPEPADLVVRCSCRVVWARPHSVDANRPGMGLEFLDLPDTVADRIDSLWQGDRQPEAPACRTWSEYDHAWVARTPRASR